jgi:hypothetical protein
LLPHEGSTPRAQRIGSGRRIGEDFNPTSLYGVIHKHPNVRAVSFLAVRVNDQPHEPVSRPIVVAPDEMVYGTPEHDIVVVPHVESEETL